MPRICTGESCSPLRRKRLAREGVLWAEHQVEEGPHHCVEAVRAFGADVTGARDVQHLLFELREASDVADLALLIEGGDRLGPARLAARCRDGFDRNVPVGGHFRMMRAYHTLLTM